MLKILWIIYSILIRNSFTNSVVIISAISIGSGNPSSYLALANIMQYLMLFIFINLSKYPSLILNFLTTNGIFSFDFFAPMFGIY